MAIQKEAIVAQALDLLDETGLDGLTMRRLADALQIKAASLYWHFTNKQALLDGMADALMREVARTPRPELAWREQLRLLAAEVRQALLARRDGARVYAGTYVVTENVMRVGEAFMAPLHAAGADHKLAAWGTFSLLYFILGFVIEEGGIRPDSMDGAELAQRNSGFTQASQAFPLLATVQPYIFDGDFDARFGFGLELMLDGLAGRIAAVAP